MKNWLALALMCLLASSSAHAQSELVKQRAMRLRDANNAQQGVTTPAPPTPNGTNGAVNGPAAGISPAQAALIEKVAADFSALKTNSASADLQTNLQKDLAALAKGGTKPTKSQLSKVTADLAVALPAAGASDSDFLALARIVNITFNSSTLTPVQARGFATNTQELLQFRGVPQANAKSVADDLKAIIADIQNNKPKLYQ